MANILGALIGAGIDRQDGDSGIKGAIIGSVAESTIRAVTPLVVTFAIGFAVQFAARRAWKAISGDDVPAAVPFKED